MSQQIGRRVCRVTVKVVAFKDLGSSASNPIAYVKVEDTLFHTTEFKKGDNGTFSVDQSNTFDVKDDKTATVAVAVAAAGKMAMRRSMVGAMEPLKVSFLLEIDSDMAGEPRWYDLISESKKKTEGKVLLQVAAARAQPEQPISIYVASWNVGNAPPPDDLSPWIPKELSSELIAVGSQECEYPPRPGHSSCNDDWVDTVRRAVGPKYKLVKSIARGQMRLVVLVLEAAQRAITDVETASEATGIGHVIANKGAVSISFNFWDTSLCFINSHLAAHEGQCKLRNQNYKEIVRNMKPGMSSADLMSQFHHVFWCGDLNYRLDILPPDSSLQPTKESDEDDEESDDDDDELAAATSAAAPAAAGHRPAQEDTFSAASVSPVPFDPAPLTTSTTTCLPVNMRSFSARLTPSTSAENSSVLRLGSSAKRLLGKSLTPKGLNSIVMGAEGIVGSFRPSSSGELKVQDKVASKSRSALHLQVLEQVTQKAFPALLEQDELLREIRENRAFCGFQEAPINFAPTFKVVRDSLTEYGKKRLPAWCDRVLWRSLPGCHLSCTEYTSAPTLLTSDHKPVSASFQLTTYALPVGVGPSEPNASPNNTEDMRWHVKFSSLTATNLLAADANGLSDPYIRFVGPTMFKPVQTKKVTKTLNPVWTDLPSLVLLPQSLHHLERDYLNVAVFDYDRTNLDDPIGYAVIPLASAVQAVLNSSTAPVPFATDVTYEGLPAGKLQGSFTLSWEVNTLSEARCNQM